MRSRCSTPCLRGSRAFTLVELLVVMATISLLVAMLLPALARTRRAAQRVQCQTGLRSYGLAALMYDSDYMELPMTSGNSNNHTTLNSDAREAIDETYGMRGSKWWHCPAAVRYERGYNTQGQYTTYAFLGGRHNYTVNANTYGWRHISRNWPKRGDGLIPQLSTQRPDRRSRMPVYVVDTAYENENARNVTVPQFSNHPRGDSRIAEGMNWLYLDGHVSWHPFISGVTWKIGGGAYQNYWWTPGDAWALPSVTYAP